MGQIEDRPENDGVRFLVEILRPQEILSHDHRFLVHQHRAQHGLLRLDALRRDAVYGQRACAVCPAPSLFLSLIRHRYPPL